MTIISLITTFGPEYEHGVVPPPLPLHTVFGVEEGVIEKVGSESVMVPFTGIVHALDIEKDV